MPGPMMPIKLTSFINPAVNWLWLSMLERSSRYSISSSANPE